MRSLLLLAAVGLSAAETGIDGWLRYTTLPSANASRLPTNIVSLNASSNRPVHAAAIELQKGISGIFNRSLNHFYNAHYVGSETVQTYPSQWEARKAKVDAQRYNETLFRLTYQAGHSLVWRDAINNFYHNLSGIADARNRVGNHPHRIEAESMNLTNYELYTVSPFEAASNFTAIVTSANATTGTASTALNVQSGTYNVAVNYYDLYGGKAQYSLSLNNKQIGAWTGNLEDVIRHTPSIYLDGHFAARITFSNIPIAKGDVLKITGKADGVEPAPPDYISVLPLGVVDWNRYTHMGGSVQIDLEADAIAVECNNVIPIHTLIVFISATQLHVCLMPDARQVYQAHTTPLSSRRPPNLTCLVT